MRCKSCKKELNSVAWYAIYTNGKIDERIRASYLCGDNVSNKKLSLHIFDTITKTRKYGFINFEKLNKIQLQKSYHCFNCGGYRADIIRDAVL